LAATIRPPTPARDEEQPPEVEPPSPAELEPIEMPVVEPPEVVPDVEVPFEEPPEVEPPPAEAAAERPFLPTPADAGKRIRTRTHAPEPASAPPPAPAPAPAPPPAGRPALHELERPDPPRPAGVPVDQSLELQLEYTVAADGHVAEARVTRSSGWPALDESTREFVLRRWRYAPPGEPRRVLRTVRFRVGG
jgi:protein TonB